MRTNTRVRCAILAVAGVAAAGLCVTSHAQVTGESPVAARTPIAVKLDLPLTSGIVITNPVDKDLERAIIDVSLPSAIDSACLDVAELVLTVSASCDPSDPLLLIVVPVTNRSSIEAMAKVADWNGVSDGTDMEFMTLTPVSPVADAQELRLDITPIVQLWQKGVIPNQGVVIRALSEDVSAFQWVKDGAYDGADARLEILYSKRKE